MNIEEFKTNWKKLDDKLNVSHQLNEKMILSILKDQSKSTVSKIQNQLKKISIFFSCILLLFVAILTGNPFDYAKWYEYLPAVAYTFLLIAGLEIVVREILAINQITLNRDNLREGLLKVIALHESYKVVMEQIWKISLLIGFFLQISVMVKNFENYGLTKSSLLIIGSGVFVVLVYFLAKYTFKNMPDRSLEELKMSLSELDE